jgi:hypothetical protein
MKKIDVTEAIFLIKAERKLTWEGIASMTINQTRLTAVRTI